MMLLICCIQIEWYLVGGEFFPFKVLLSCRWLAGSKNRKISREFSRLRVVVIGKCNRHLSYLHRNVLIIWSRDYYRQKKVKRKRFFWSQHGYRDIHYKYYLYQCFQPISWPPSICGSKNPRNFFPSAVHLAPYDWLFRTSNINTSCYKKNIQLIRGNNGAFTYRKPMYVDPLSVAHDLPQNIFCLLIL